MLHSNIQMVSWMQVDHHLLATDPNVSDTTHAFLACESHQPTISYLLPCHREYQLQHNLDEVWQSAKFARGQQLVLLLASLYSQFVYRSLEYSMFQHLPEVQAR